MGSRRKGGRMRKIERKNENQRERTRKREILSRLNSMLRDA